MKIKATFTRALQGELGAQEITFTTYDKDSVLKLKTQDKAKPLSLEVKQYREQRSLDANAYFHVLVSKIADVDYQSIDDVKRQLVCDYGTVAFIARIPASANLDEIYKYSKLIGESKGTKEPCNDWYIFKPTHTLDSKEMSRLIEGTVQEAQQLGIETKTPKEIAELTSLWGKAQ
ncbi:MAG: hypothetical protein ACI4MZ_03705 [Christensenellales bacterium]